MKFIIPLFILLFISSNSCDASTQHAGKESEKPGDVPCEYVDFVDTYLITDFDTIHGVFTLISFSSDEKRFIDRYNMVYWIQDSSNLSIYVNNKVEITESRIIQGACSPSTITNIEFLSPNDSI